MATQCNETKLRLHDLDSREVMGPFDGGEISCDAGGILLRKGKKRTGIIGCGAMESTGVWRQRWKTLGETLNIALSRPVLTSTCADADSRCVGDRMPPKAFRKRPHSKVGALRRTVERW